MGSVLSADLRWNWERPELPGYGNSPSAGTGKVLTPAEKQSPGYLLVGGFLCPAHEKTSWVFHSAPGIKSRVTNAIARDSTSESQLFQTLDLEAKVQEPLPENLRRREATLFPVH